MLTTLKAARRATTAGNGLMLPKVRSRELQRKGRCQGIGSIDNVTLPARACCVIRDRGAQFVLVLPCDGGKIASLRFYTGLRTPPASRRLR